jgi:hypothetical protein
MATAASGLKTITPDQVVSITLLNGVATPNPDPVTVPSGGSVQFVNNISGQDYALELFTNDNQKHLVTSLYLAAGGGSAILVADSDPNDKGKKCFYNIEAYTAPMLENKAKSSGPITDNTSGGHSIIIGSGEPG